MNRSRLLPAALVLFINLLGGNAIQGELKLSPSYGDTTSNFTDVVCHEGKMPDDINSLKNKNMNKENPQYIIHGWESCSQSNRINSDSLPVNTFLIKIDSINKMEEGYEAGVSGFYAGVANGTGIIAGGCNFPVNPLASDSKKKFYKGIYRIKKEGLNEWEPEKLGELPYPMAYGNGVTFPEGLVLMGGANNSESFDNVFLLTLENDNDLNITTLPSLPGKIDNAAATAIGSTIYIAGGNVDGKPSNKIFSLDIKNYNKGWEELPSFPGNPRVQPVMASGIDANGNENIYIWGGFCGKFEGRDASLETNGLKYEIKTGKWIPVEGPKDENGEDFSIGGGAATSLEDGRIIVTGGVNKDIFLEALRNQAPDYLSHPVEWYRFNPYIFIFDPKNEKWKINFATPKTARAGAGMLPTGDGKVLVIGGEIKPRIRTAEIFEIDNL